jgi:hypothetical protein
LGAFKVEDLSKEPHRLNDEKTTIHEQTQELAVTNYKTFIETAQCSRDLFTQFNSIESKLDQLLDDIPNFEQKCQSFGEETSGINNLRRLNSLTLTRNAQLLEILELPQLMNSFINDGLYEDALELAGYVRKLHTKHPDIPIFKVKKQTRCCDNLSLETISEHRRRRRQSLAADAAPVVEPVEAGVDTAQVSTDCWSLAQDAGFYRDRAEVEVFTDEERVVADVSRHHSEG